jgi:Tfp pilus assembly protein PilO
VDFLKKIQNQPEEKRKSQMVFFVTIASLVVIIAWLLVFFPKSVEKNKKEGREDWLSKTAGEINKEISNKNFFGSFKENISKLTNKKTPAQDEKETAKNKRLPIESKEQENKRTQEQK